MLASAQDKHNRALSNLREEKDDLESKVTELENKVRKKLASVQDKHKRALSNLREEKDDLESKIIELENKVHFF